MSQGKQIKQEVAIHNTIIDNLDVKTDKAIDQLRTEADHANKIRKTTQYCYFYITIAILCIILLILILVGFAGR